MFVSNILFPGHLHAIYLLGELHADGIIIKRNCHFAVEVLSVEVLN